MNLLTFELTPKQYRRIANLLERMLERLEAEIKDEKDASWISTFEKNAKAENAKAIKAFLNILDGDFDA